MGFIRLRVELRALRSVIEELRDAIQEHSRTIHAEQEAQRNEKPIAKPIHAVIAYDEHTIRDSKEENERQYRTQRSIKRAAWCAFGAAVIYAGIAAFQWYEMRKTTHAAIEAAKQARRANDDAENRFREEQRPYVWLTSNGLGSPEFIPLPTPARSDNGQVLWTWHYTNYGKTPAYHIHFRHSISIDGSPFVESYKASPEGSLGPPLPPTQDVFATVVSKAVTRGQFAHATSISGKGISISVKLEYTDADGGSYESEMYLLRLNTGAISYCREGNRIK